MGRLGNPLGESLMLKLDPFSWASHLPEIPADSFLESIYLDASVLGTEWRKRAGISLIHYIDGLLINSYFQCVTPLLSVLGFS